MIKLKKILSNFLSTPKEIPEIEKPTISISNKRKYGSLLHDNEEIEIFNEAYNQDLYKLRVSLANDYKEKIENLILKELSLEDLLKIKEKVQKEIDTRK